VTLICRIRSSKYRMSKRPIPMPTSISSFAHTDEKLPSAVSRWWMSLVRVVRIADAIVRGRVGDYAATAESWPWASGARPIAGTRIGESISPRSRGGGPLP
jgi:hypothetical protein